MFEENTFWVPVTHLSNEHLEEVYISTFNKIRLNEFHNKGYNVDDFQLLKDCGNELKRRGAVVLKSLQVVW